MWIYCFNGSNVGACKLYVPTGTSSAYSKAEWWEEFGRIIEEDLSSSLAVETDNVSISFSNKGISIHSIQCIELSIYTLSGQKVYHNNVQSSINIPLETGIYIVKAGNTIHKIIL